MADSGVSYTVLVRSDELGVTLTASKFVEAQTRPHIGESVAYGSDSSPKYGKVMKVFHEDGGRLTVELDYVTTDFLERLIDQGGWEQFAA